MRWKKFLIELLELNTLYHVYKSAGLSDGAAFSCAHADYENALGNSPSKGRVNVNEEMAKIEARKQRLEKTKSDIAERRRKLYEKNSWLLEKHQTGKD